MFGEVGIEGGAAFEALVVVIDDLLKGGESSIVHVGCSEGNVAKAGGAEFELITVLFGDDGEAKII